MSTDEHQGANTQKLHLTKKNIDYMPLLLQLPFMVQYNNKRHTKPSNNVSHNFLTFLKFEIAALVPVELF